METKNELHDDSPEANFGLYSLETLEGSHCALLQAPTVTGDSQSASSNTFNILMADCSGSMHGSWHHVVDGWNSYVAKKLTGTTKLYAFDTNVIFLREGTTLFNEDNQGGCTNLTMALAQVMKDVRSCRQSFVQVFIVTDGAHTAGEPYPEEMINQMISPSGKTVNVHLLGISNSFPVNYSIDIRSRLHSGSANLPSLYWAKVPSEILEQMEAIGNDLGSHVKMVLNQEGFVLPGLPGTRSVCRGEWLYFPKAVEELMNLKVSIDDEEEREIPLPARKATMGTLLDHVFPQWNSVLIQQHRKGLHVPMETFKLMESLFQKQLEGHKITGNSMSSIKARLEGKKLKTYEVTFKTLMNTSRSVIEVEGMYRNEMELANNILKSTVSGRKYDTQVLKIRGHGLDDYEKDKNEFFKIFKELQETIRALPNPQPEECCRITLSSTLSDLQDKDFLLMQEEDKYELLKNFTMSGIPAFAPIHDAAKINPWALTINHILVTPFTVLSQRAIEAFAGVEGGSSLGATNKEVKLKEDDENSRFNIVIPIIPPYAAAVLKPLVRSKLYAMLSTFSILKDPHIVDYSAHLAALACAWVKSVADHPPVSRPEYITDRLASIVATAELYMDRKTIMQYLLALSNTPNKALMTETTDPTTDQTLKCESLVKPLFILGMRKDRFTTSDLTGILRLLLLEFIGRCLSSYKVREKNPSPYTDFFVAELSDHVKKEEWLAKESQSIVNEFTSSCGDLLEKFYTPEALQKEFKIFVNKKKATLGDRLIKSIPFAVDMEKVKRLKYIGSCGDVTFHTFHPWAQEMGVPEDDILAAYDPKKVMMYVCEALSFRSSKERLDKEQWSYTKCMEHVKSQVTRENEKSLLESLKVKVHGLKDQWRTQYLKVHEPLVMPLTPQQVVSQAQARGIKVTEKTFQEVYKRYDAESGLLHNACQIPDCPYYLFPSRSFNQHLSVERASGEFPHSLHLVSRELNSETVDRVVDAVISGTHSGQNGRKTYSMSDPHFLERMKSDIEHLMSIYKGLFPPD